MAGINFPFVIYHPVETPKIVMNEADLKLNLDKGWRVSPVESTAKEMIKSKISWHKNEIKTLEKNLAAIEKSEKYTSAAESAKAEIEAEMEAEAEAEKVKEPKAGAKYNPATKTWE